MSYKRGYGLIALLIPCLFLLLSNTSTKHSASGDKGIEDDVTTRTNTWRDFFKQLGFTQTVSTPPEDNAVQQIQEVSATPAGEFWSLLEVTRLFSIPMAIRINLYTGEVRLQPIGELSYIVLNNLMGSRS